MKEQPEAHCLSALMKSPEDVYAALAAGLEESHFADPLCACVFSAICRAAAASKDTGVHAVWLQLANMAGESTPTLPDLLHIDNLHPTSALRADLVAGVIGNAKRRKLHRELTAAADLASTETAHSFDEVWERVAPHIEAAQSVTARGSRRSIGDMAESLAKQVEKPESRKVISTGWARWDAKATPLKAGEMITVAARPGCGKTALGIQIAVKAATSGERVVLFSLEMSGEEVVDRIAKVRGGNGVLHNRAEYLGEIRRAAKLDRLHIYDNAERHTMASIEARARLHTGMAGGLGLVVIDYLQLIEPADRRAPREQQVAEMSRRCKQLAGILHCPVMVLAQLNREIEKDDRKPRLSDLRESGAIEQDSDRVWFLWQDPKTVISGAEEASSIEVLLLQCKCRGGPPNVGARMQFNRPIFTFNQQINES